MTYYHLENLEVNPIFSEDKKNRYWLEINKINSKNTKTICIIMQNPSIASKTEADRSVNILEKLVFEKGYAFFKDVGKIIIVNQFPLIQTRNFEGNDNVTDTTNINFVKKAIKRSEIILIAWGISNYYPNHQKNIENIISQHKNKQLLKTKKHPSRSSYDDFFTPYNIVAA